MEQPLGQWNLGRMWVRLGHSVGETWPRLSCEDALWLVGLCIMACDMMDHDEASSSLICMMATCVGAL